MRVAGFLSFKVIKMSELSSGYVDHVAIWPCGYVAMLTMWPFDQVAMLSMWPCGYVAMWLCWPCGHVAMLTMWLCGYNDHVAMWLCWPCGHGIDLCNVPYNRRLKNFQFHRNQCTSISASCLLWVGSLVQMQWSMKLVYRMLDKVDPSFAHSNAKVLWASVWVSFVRFKSQLISVTWIIW